MAAEKTEEDTDETHLDVTAHNRFSDYVLLKKLHWDGC